MKTLWTTMKKTKKTMMKKTRMKTAKKIIRSRSYRHQSKGREGSHTSGTFM